ncbi:MAG TPA: HAD family hydrolase [Gaiellaceae bacterium]|nr:HAD family hydrolase [Gaiellaceae bacterium]
MALSFVVFDVGETLVDETAMWERAADSAGVPRFTLMGVLGGLAARGEQHTRVWEILGVERPQGAPYARTSLYPDAEPCLRRLRDRYRLGLAGNASREAYARLGVEVDFIANSTVWGIEKPEPAFFDRVAETCGCAPEEIAYVGDRVDNDVVPARAAGMLAVHLRRGPWGYLHDAPAGTPTIDSLAELPGVLERA